MEKKWVRFPGKLDNLGTTERKNSIGFF